MPRSHRLLRPSEYAATLHGGRKSRDGLFTVFARETALAHGRLGLAISRRASPKAVVRNRLKRYVRESFRQHQHMLHGLDIVVMGGAAASDADSSELRRSLKRHWEKIAQ